MNLVSVSSQVAISTNAGAASPPTSAVLEDELKLDGATYDAAMTMSVTFERTEKEQAEFDYSVSLEHRQTPALQADTALNTIDDQIRKVQKAVYAERPELARASWDFTVENGKLKVTGNLQSDDKQWLESKLNGNGTLVAAVGSYMKSAVDFLETTAKNPAYHSVNTYSGKTQAYNFENVKTQLEGVISFRELSAASWKSHLNPSTGAYGDPGNYRGWDSIEVLASRLKPSESAQG